MYMEPDTDQELEDRARAQRVAALIEEAGYVVVPKVPTPEMCDRIIPLWLASDQERTAEDYAEAKGWIAAVIAAAPKFL